MAKPMVSVVMVVRNVDRFLAESIDSILQQTFRDFEFIIIDFGSTDRSEIIASSFAAKDSRIRLHKIPQCGLAEARNAGCFLAQGRYIAIMDADDISLPNRLLWEVEFAEQHPEVGLVGGATEWIDATGRPLGVRGFPTDDHEIRSELLTRCLFCQSTVLIRRYTFAAVGGYRAMFSQTEDYDLWLRIADKSRVANLKQVVLKYRIHSYQLSIRKQKEQTICKLAAQASAHQRKNGFRDPLDELEEITPAVLADLGVSEKNRQTDIVSECAQWIDNMSRAGEYSAALEGALELLRSDLKHVEKWRIADLHLAVMRLCWKQNRPLSSAISAGHAVLAHPVVIARPLKPFLQRLGLVATK